MVDNTARTRVWCPAAAYDLTLDGMSTPVEYPGEGATSTWCGSPTPSARATRYLVARGDDYTLQPGSANPDGTLVTSDQPLPEDVALLTPEERVVPIRLPVQAGGPIGPRARRPGFLEIVVPGMGWQRVPGSAWPQEARIRATTPSP
ncbi:MAG: hypothetical protein R3F43_10935 [bacterium]